MRQEPKAFSVSVAQSFGTDVPARAAARMTEVPAGTRDGLAVDLHRDRSGRLDGGRCPEILVIDREHG